MRLKPLIAGVALLALSGCGSQSSNTWKDLRTVRVTVARPGLPPPGGLPRTTTFVTSSELARVTTALNKNHIVQRSATTSNGCAGGQQVAITIVRRDGPPAAMIGYRCGGKTSGAIGGNLDGFLTAIGITTAS